MGNYTTRPVLLPMVIYKTTFKNIDSEPICLGDILRHPETGKEYIVVFDADLAEAFQDLKGKTVEKMTDDLSQQLVTVERREDGPLGE